MNKIVVVLLLNFAVQITPEDKTILTLDGEFFQSDISLVKISTHVAKTQEVVNSLHKLTESLPDTLEGRVINASVKNKHQRFLHLKQVRKTLLCPAYPPLR